MPLEALWGTYPHPGEDKYYKNIPYLASLPFTDGLPGQDIANPPTGKTYSLTAFRDCAQREMIRNAYGYLPIISDAYAKRAIKRTAIVSERPVHPRTGAGGGANWQQVIAQR